MTQTGETQGSNMKAIVVKLRPQQALNSIYCLLLLLLAGSFELSPTAEAVSCSGNSTAQQVGKYCTETWYHGQCVRKGPQLMT